MADDKYINRKSGLLNYETYKRKDDKRSTESVNRALNDDFGPLGYDVQDMLARADYDRANKEAENELKREASRAETMKTVNKKKGGMIKSSASKRADGIAQRGKTRGRIV